MKNNLFNKAADNWLQKAKDDLCWAKCSLNDGIYYGCCFICQQAVEKALKSFLLTKNRKYPKIHDLTRLIIECASYNARIKRYLKSATILSSYYIEARYPDLGDFQHYTKKDAEQAYKIAKSIITYLNQ